MISMNSPHLLLLHGAIGSAAQFDPLLPLLTGSFTLHTLDFEGHGPAPSRGRPFRMEHFAENVLEYLSQNGIAQTHIFGYSMGGYVACALAASHPDAVTGIATLGTKFYWDDDTARRETALLDPQKIAAKVPHFAQALAERHTAYGWEAVLAATADLLHHLGSVNGFRPPDAASIQCPVRVMLGDRDTTVTLEETRDIYRALPHGQMEVLPATPHQFERVSPPKLAHSLIEFFGAGSS
jgi:pimeloyl-ACP methyl ester carboxylesterase